MKKLIVICGLIFYTMCSSVYALGSLAHNYVAKHTFNGLKETMPELYRIIDAHYDEFLIGSDYPDVGFVPGADFGEVSHWQPFVDAFIHHLHERYPTPSVKRDKLIAFLMGITTHIESDIVAHWTYYNLVAEMDFQNKPDTHTAWRHAHQDMDIGSDFFVIVHEGIHSKPLEWWLPVDDLLAIYDHMNVPITKMALIRANVIYYVGTGLIENTIAYPGYAYLRYYKTPWGMTHWLSHSDEHRNYGAFPDQIAKCQTYINAVWNQYNKTQAVNALPIKNPTIPHPLNVFQKLAVNAYEHGWIKIQSPTTADEFIINESTLTFTPEFYVLKSKLMDELMRQFERRP